MNRQADKQNRLFSNRPTRDTIKVVPQTSKEKILNKSFGKKAIWEVFQMDKSFKYQKR